MDDLSFYQILDHFNLSHKGYRKVRKGVKKRLSKHMQQQGVKTADQHIAALSRTPAIAEETRMHLTVSISRFFRDKRFWDVLENQLLPQMLPIHRGVFRVWSCGCARGEEAYSFKMVWDRLQEGLPNLPEHELWATDINPDYLEMAQQAAYGISSIKELPRSFVDRYFDKVPGKQRYIVKPLLKEGIRFYRHDIIKQPPPSTRFSLVFLRNNLLTYYRPPEKDRSLDAILRAMIPGGMLITGSHEKIPNRFGLLKTVSELPWIYAKPRSSQS